MLSRPLALLLPTLLLAMIPSSVRSFATTAAARGSLLSTRGASALARPAAAGAALQQSQQRRTAPAPRFMSTPTEDELTVVETCREKIAKALETDDVEVLGAYDDPNGSHISIKVTSSLFEGKRPVQRQQLVYKALWEELQGAVHAVDSMQCKTPDEK